MMGYVPAGELIDITEFRDARPKYIDRGGKIWTPPDFHMPIAYIGTAETANDPRFDIVAQAWAAVFGEKKCSYCKREAPKCGCGAEDYR